jgi:hypothetical protein
MANKIQSFEDPYPKADSFVKSPTTLTYFNDTIKVNHKLPFLRSEASKQD